MQRGRMLSWFVVWSVAALCCVTLHGVEAMTLKIMTYNIHHGADVRDRVDLERVVQTLRVHVPDVVFLSEVDQYWYRSGLVRISRLFYSQAAGMPFHHYAPALVTSSLVGDPPRATSPLWQPLSLAKALFSRELRTAASAWKQ